MCVSFDGGRYARQPPVFRRFRRVFGSSSEEKYHKSEKNHKKPKRYNGLSSEKWYENVNPRKVHPRNHTKRHERFIHERTRNWHERFIHETSTKGLSTKLARKVYPIKKTLVPLFPLHLCSYSPPSTKGRESGTKACLATSVFYTLLINIGSIVPGAPAALGIGAASFDGEGGDVDGKDTAESPTA